MSFNISILIPWCDRPEISKTFKHNFDYYCRLNAEVIVLNCGGNRAQLQSYLDEFRLSSLVTVTIPHTRFNKALALNMGISLSTADVLFTLDADILLNNETLRFNDHDLDDSFVTVSRMVESDPGSPALRYLASDKCCRILSAHQTHVFSFTLLDGTHCSVTTSHKNLMDNSRAGAGLLLSRKQHLVGVNGYNSDLEHWGWEDNDIQLRLQRVLGLKHVQSGEVVHLSHSDDWRAMYGESRDTLTWLNLTRSLEKYAEHDFAGSLERDFFKWSSQLLVEKRQGDL